MRLDAGENALEIQCYDQIPGMYGSDMVYRLYCDNPTQFQSHTQILHGKISMAQISGTAE